MNKLTPHEHTKLKERFSAILTAPAADRERLIKKADTYANLLLHKHRYSKRTHTIDLVTGIIREKEE